MTLKPNNLKDRRKQNPRQNPDRCGGTPDDVSEGLLSVRPGWVTEQGPVSETKQIKTNQQNPKPINQIAHCLSLLKLF